MPNTGSFVIPVATLSTQWAASDYAVLRVASVAQQDVLVDFHPTAGNRMAGFSSIQAAFVTQ